jgi:hypothetical protein
MTLPTSDAETIALLLATSEDVKQLHRTYRRVARALADRKRDLTEILIAVELREKR